MDILVIKSARTFKNVGIISISSKGNYYRGSGEFNQNALQLMLERERFFENIDEDGNFYSQLVQFSKPACTKYVKRVLPSFWFVSNHFQGDKLDKDKYYTDFIQAKGEPTRWVKIT